MASAIRRPRLDVTIASDAAASTTVTAITRATARRSPGYWLSTASSVTIPATTASGAAICATRPPPVSAATPPPTSAAVNGASSET